MLFTLIVPVYNGEKFLEECLSSIEQQDFEDYELIIVDDGSVDASGDIADDFATTHQNANVLHGANEGLLLARRRGLSFARGEYVVFVDADDTISHNALSTLAEVAAVTKADIISFRYSRRSDFSTSDDVPALASGVYSGDSYQQAMSAVLRGRSNNLCGKAFRRRCIDSEINYKTYGRLMLAEDLLQQLPIIDRSKSFAQIDKALYFYRPNPSSSTAWFRHSYIQDTEAVVDRVLNYGTRWDMPKEATAGVLQLYVNAAKIIADYKGHAEHDEALRELDSLRLSMRKVSPSIQTDIKRLSRIDHKLVLNAVLRNDLAMIRVVASLSRTAWMLLGHLEGASFSSFMYKESDRAS